MEADQNSTTPTVQPPTPEAVERARSTAGFHASMPFDVKMPDMELFILTKDQIKNLQGKASEDSLFFGASLTVVLTCASIAIPLYISGNTGKIFGALCLATVLFLLPTLSYGLSYLRNRRNSQTQLREIEEKSRTVIKLVPESVEPQP